jgi:hypothetical protein
VRLECTDCPPRGDQAEKRVKEQQSAQQKPEIFSKAKHQKHQAREIGTKFNRFSKVC